MAMPPIPNELRKDPKAVLDWKVKWKTWLGDDVIVGCDFTAEAPVEVASTSYTDEDTTVWLFGGDNRSKPEIICEIDTASGRHAVFRFHLPIRENVYNPHRDLYGGY